jgi:site-specific DNA recombinase
MCHFRSDRVPGPDGKKIIAPDPETAPLITRLFEWYATGTYP